MHPCLDASLVLYLKPRMDPSMLPHHQNTTFRNYTIQPMIGTYFYWTQSIFSTYHVCYPLLWRYHLTSNTQFVVSSTLVYMLTLGLAWDPVFSLSTHTLSFIIVSHNSKVLYGNVVNTMNIILRGGLGLGDVWWFGKPSHEARIGSCGY